MERELEAWNGKKREKSRTRRQAPDSREVGPGRRMLAFPVAPVPTPTAMVQQLKAAAAYSNEARLAAIAVHFNVRLRSADMPGAMQERAFRCTRTLLDSTLHIQKHPNPTRLALLLKKEFDTVYGPAWHCIAGKSFGSYVTHSTGGFVYFSVDKLCFLLFKTEVQPVKKSPPLLKFKHKY